MVAEGVDDRLPGGRAVLERLQVQRNAAVGVDPLRQVRRECVDVVAAALERRDRAWDSRRWRPAGRGLFEALDWFLRERTRLERQS